MNNIFEHTTRITFELSNLCNFRDRHPKCPASLVKEPIILSEAIIYHVLETCKEYNYKGTIAFHRYNEPTNDPRLMLFIEKARDVCGSILLMTNGSYYNKMLEKEFYAHGVTEIMVSKYPGTGFDDRLEMLMKSDLNLKKPCFAPLNDITINCEGKMALCCYDWKNMHTFGDLNNQTLPEILMSDEVYNTYKCLSKGDRFLTFCKKCSGER